MLNISGFMSTVAQSGGFALQSRYDVMIPTLALASASTVIFQAIQKYTNNISPNALDWMNEYFSGNLTQEAITLAAYCERSVLPGVQYQMENSRTYGPAFKIPHLAEYQDITMTFLCGNLMLERAFFDAWMFLVMDPLSNNCNYISEYCADITIKQQSESGQSVDSVVPNYQTVLIDAFPVAVNPQELGYEMVNAVQKLEVTFTYKYASPLGNTSTGAGTGIRVTPTAFNPNIT